MPPTPSLAARLVPLLLLGYAVGAARYLCEFIAPAYAMYFGLYYIMPIAFLAIGMRGTWGRIPWPALAGTMFLLALLTWGVWNSIAYTTGQFMGWEHGRFEPGVRAAPIAESTFAKVGWGLAGGGLTALAGSVWCIVLGTLLIWLPGIVRGRRG